MNYYFQIQYEDYPPEYYKRFKYEDQYGKYYWNVMATYSEERYKKLEAEGLFDPKRKKPIPSIPQKIGIVTSPTGAAIKDILTRSQNGVNVGR